MCGAHGYSVKDAKEVYDRFEVTNTLEAYTPRWNVRIGQMAPVIYMMADGVPCTWVSQKHHCETVKIEANFFIIKLMLCDMNGGKKIRTIR
jgi:hypothetical protein